MIGLRHRRTRRLLPWLVNETLEPAERRRLETHLASCSRCRDERAAEVELAARVAALPTPEVRPHPARLAAVLTRLDDARPNGRARGAGDRHSRWLPAPVGVWLIVGAQALAVALIAALLLVDRRPEPPAYRTLTTPSEAGSETAPAAAQRLRMVFAPEVTAASIGRLLESVGGRIVDGPTPLGVYTVELTPGASAVEVERALLTLREREGVLLAEPVR